MNKQLLFRLSRSVPFVLFSILLLFCRSEVKGQAVTATWALTSTGAGVGSGAGAANMTVGTMSPGSEFASGNYSSNGYECQSTVTWPSSATTSPGYYLDFPVSPVTGYDLTLSSFSCIIKTSGSSNPSDVSLEYALDGSSSFTPFSTTLSINSGGTTTVGTTSFTSFTCSSGHTMVIRMYIYAGSGGNSSSRNVYIRNFVLNGTTAVTVSPTPVVTTGPSNVITCFGVNSSFSAAFTGAISYQWQRSTTGIGGTFVNIDGVIDGAIYSNYTTTTLNIAGTPSALNGYAYQLVATNASGNTTTTPATLTVSSAVTTPVFALGGTSTRCQGAGSVTYTATASNSTGIMYSLDAGSTTAGNSINASTGAVTYVAGWSGTSIITASAAGCSGPLTATHTVTITPTVSAPVFVSGGTSSRCQGAGTVTYGATAVNSTSITYSLDAASTTAGNTINSATGAVTYVAGWSGTSVITASAAGCNGPVTATHTETITPTVGDPVFALGTTSTRCQGAGSVTYATTATNSTGITYSLDAVSTTAGNTINSSTGAVTYVSGWSGISVITASATGCNGPATSNHTVTVTPTVGTPVFAAGGTSTRCQGAGSVTYGASATSSTSITYSLDAASATAGNTINSSTGAVTYIAGWSGTTTITATAAGCNGPLGATHTVTITPTVSTPVFILNSTSTRCQGVGSVTYTATAANTTGITYSLDAISTTAGNSIDAATGIVTYVAGWSGTTVITASAAGCNGPVAAIHTVTVYPTPNAVASQPSQPVCNGAITTAINFTGAVAGTSFSWTNNNTSTGLSGTGSGSISAFTATNITVVPAISTITVTPTANGCTGSTITATITVEPTPAVIASPIAQTLCSNATTSVIGFTGTVSGTTFGWSNTTPSIGLSGTGSGNIAGFTATNTTNAPVIATVTVIPVANGCSGPSQTSTIIVDPTPGVTISQPSQSLCNNASSIVINFTNAVSGTTFNWTNNTPSIGLLNTGTGNIASFTAFNTTSAPVTATVTVIPTANSCPGAPQTATITVNPTPSVSVAPASQSVCNGAMTTAIGVSGPVSGSLYSWSNNITSTGLSGTGAGSISSFTGSNSTTAPVTSTITFIPTANGCTGTSQTATIIVYPTPVVSVTPASQTICNSANSSIITFSSNTAGTTYAWSNNTTSIGLAASGSGPIIGNFIASNTGTSGVTATISVVPTANGCTGSAQPATILVNPTPVVGLLPNDQTVCNNTLTTAITFTPTVAGTTYAWTNTTPSIGLASSGTSNGIATFTATNSTAFQTSAIINVTPTANGCVGSAQFVTIEVNPTPVATITPSTQTVCNTANTTGLSFSSSLFVGTSYTWTNNTTSIGLAGSGNSSVPSFTASNIGTAPVTATITVVPVASGCTGAPVTATITAEPTPTIAISPTSQTVCNGATTTQVNFTGAIAGTTYPWTNNSPSINLASAGSGNIPSFVASNTGISAVKSVITVTPTANGCTGASQTDTIIVDPTPNIVVTPSTQSVCNGATTQTISFSGGVIGTTYTWTNNNTGIGLSGGSIGNVASFTAINTGNTPITATITVVPSASTCTGASQTATITVDPTPTVTISQLSQSICNNTTTTAINFTGPVTGTAYTWTNSTTSVNLAASGNGNIGGFTAANTTNSAVTATITVTPTANSCIGTQQTATITVRPTPAVTLTPATQAVCNGTTTTTIVDGSTVAGTTYAWVNNTTSISLAASGTGNINSFTAVNTGTSTAIATITVTPTANGCTGASQTGTITVYPTPNVAITPSTQTICNNTATTGITFTGAVNGTSYSWSNNNASIGLPGSGSGNNIAIFPAVNTGTTPVTATITVVPTANTCIGSSQTATITVNPTPAVTLIPLAQTVCNNTTTTQITEAGTVAGTSYTWTNSNTSVGLPASGTGTIGAFNAANSGSTAVLATITVIPTANGCAGLSQTSTVIVDPTPTVTASPPTQAVCNNATTANIVFSSPVAGATYAWANNNTSIGLGGSGAGNIASFTGINTGNAPVTATVTVTPSANGCTGPSQLAAITIDPTPTVTISPANQTICNNTQTTLVVFGGAVSGTVYNWTNNTASIGLAAAGTGNINSFNAINNGTTPITATITVIPVANSCPGTPQTASLTVGPSPVLSITPTTQTLCSNASTNTIAFSSNLIGTTYAWTNTTPSVGLLSTGSGNSIPSFTASNTGSAPITAVVTITPTSSTCNGIAQTATITVDPIPPAFINASANTTSCDHDSVTLNASFGNTFTYLWKLNGAYIPNAVGSAYVAHTSGNYSVVVTSLGCSDTSVAHTVTLHAIPSTPIYNVGGFLTHCDGDSVVLGTAINYSLNYAYQWQLNGSDINGATNATFNAFPAGDYRVIVTSSICIGVSPIITVSVDPRPDSTGIMYDHLVMCPGGVSELYVDSSSPYTYQWYMDGTLSPGATQPSYAASASGDYRIRLTNVLGCSFTTQPVDVAYAPVPAPQITDNNGQLCAQQGYNTYQWYLDGTAIQGATGACISNIAQAGGYTVAVTNATGCSGTSAIFYFNSGVVNVAPDAIKLYPNPATSVVNVAAQQKVNISLSGLDGKQLMYVDDAKTIDISDLTNAVYLMKVYDRNNTLIKVEKLVKTSW